MASVVKQSKNACCLIYGKNSTFLQSLLKELGGRDVEDTTVVTDDGSPAVAYTCEVELDSKYQFVRLRFIASECIDALKLDRCIKDVYQSPFGSVPQVCSFLGVIHTNDEPIDWEDQVGEFKKSLDVLSQIWSPEGRMILSVPSFSLLESHHSDLKNDLVKWCLNNQIEMIDMTPEDDDCESFCEDGREAEEYGAKRILSALTVASAYVKEEDATLSHQFHRLSSEGSDSSSESDDKESVLPSIVPEPNEQPSGSSSSLLNQQPEGVEQFEALFARLASMKERCQAMSHGEERNAYAEQVVTAFWKAIGGEDEEIDNSSSFSSSMSPSPKALSGDEDEATENLVVPQDE